MSDKTCGCAEKTREARSNGEAGTYSCSRCPVATYDAGTDPVPRLEPHLPAIRAAVAKAGADGGALPVIATEPRESFRVDWTYGGAPVGHSMHPLPTAPTPAAMLGEAHDLFRRMCTLIVKAHDASGGTGESRKALLPHFNDFGNWLVDLKREAEAREGQGMSTECPSCGASVPNDALSILEHGRRHA